MESYLDEVDSGDREPLLYELLRLELDYRRRRGEPFSREIVWSGSPMRG
jgi:hypothetical protein